MFKTAYNIRISIGYKDNFCQVFGINQIFFKTSIKQVSIFFLKKLVFKPEPDPNKKVKPRKPTRTLKKFVIKPEPDPISGLSRVGSGFFRFG